MVGKVSSLMKTVKNVEDEAARGVQSLEATIDSIESELRVSTAMAQTEIHLCDMLHVDICIISKNNNLIYM